VYTIALKPLKVKGKNKMADIYFLKILVKKEN